MAVFFAEPLAPVDFLVVVFFAAVFLAAAFFGFSAAASSVVPVAVSPAGAVADFLVVRLRVAFFAGGVVAASLDSVPDSLPDAGAEVSA